VRLEDQAARGWEQLPERLGVTRTAIAEALGQMLDEGVWTPPVEAVTRARRIDRERRRR
jgi:biotin operon repressor